MYHWQITLMLKDLKTRLHALADPEKAKRLQRFFKTRKGEYAEGDKFLGIVVPMQRKVAKEFRSLSLMELKKLLHSKWHEERLVALFIMVDQFKRGDAEQRAQLYNFYLSSTTVINNWDLVDSSASYIVGGYLFDRDRSILTKLACSSLLWERRIAVIATLFFISKDQFHDTLKITELLLSDKHDLIHKACGWMLREVGKRDQNVLIHFLEKHAAHMPRTMLRYAIEHFSPEERKHYLNLRFKMQDSK